MVVAGEKLPWTVELSEWSAFTLHTGCVSQPLMCGLSVTSTVGATVHYNPPTSDLIHSLALCLHLDLRPPLISLSHSQVNSPTICTPYTLGALCVLNISQGACMKLKCAKIPYQLPDDLTMMIFCLALLVLTSTCLYV